MGVRALNNIKIVKNSPTGNINNLNIQPSVISPLFIDPKKIKLANLSLINEAKLNEKNSLAFNEAREFLSIWSEIRNNYEINRSDYSAYDNVLDFLNNISDILSYGINHQEFSVNDYKKMDRKLRPNSRWVTRTKIIDFILSSGLLSKDGDMYHITNKGKAFNRTLIKSDSSVPFEWDYFIKPKFNEIPYYPPLSPNNSFTNLDIGGQKYVLETYKGQDDISQQSISTIFYKDTGFNGKKKRIMLNLPAFEEPLDSESIKPKILQYLLDSTKNADVEMAPIASNNTWSTFQGTVDNQPVYAYISNSILSYCRNVYGDNLRMVLDSKGMLNDPEQGVYRARFFIIGDDNSVVYSFTDKLLEALGSQTIGNRTYFNNIANNMNIFKSI